MMKRVLLIIVVLLTTGARLPGAGIAGLLGAAVTPLPSANVGGPSVVATQQPDFSGTWQLDAGASQVTAEQGLAGLGSAAPEFLHVTHARNGALILSSRTNGAQPRNYIVGGRNALPAPGGEDARITMATRWEGEALVSIGEGEFEGAALQVRERMSLDADGSLRLEVTTMLGDTSITNALVYRREGR